MANMFLIFDRYFEQSIKSATCSNRDVGASRVYHLSSSTNLPSQKVMLTVSKNKQQLIDLIIRDLCAHKAEVSIFNTLIVTGSEPFPIEITNDDIIQCESLKTLQEEADTIIIDQLSRTKDRTSFVYSDYTDVFVLLLHFVHIGSINSSVFLMPTSESIMAIDINLTISKYQSIIHNVLPAHALSGCDTVGTTHNISK